MLQDNSHIFPHIIETLSLPSYLYSITSWSSSASSRDCAGKSKALPQYTLRKKCPIKEFFLVRIFLYLDRIRRSTLQISVFSPNTGKYGPEKTPYLDIFYAVTENSNKNKTKHISLTSAMTEWTNLLYNLHSLNSLNEFEANILKLKQIFSEFLIISFS